MDNHYENEGDIAAGKLVRIYPMSGLEGYTVKEWKENGTPIVGASANSVVATANEYNEISFTKIIRLCPRENVTLTIGSVPAVSGVTPVVETVAPTVKNANIIIEKVRF